MTDYVCLPTGRNVPLAWRETREQAFQDALRDAYGIAPARCLCREPDGDARRLSIRSLGRPDRPHYILARFPESGHEHDRACQFFEAPASASGRGSYSTGVIAERDDGSVAVRLAIPLDRAPTSTSTPIAPRADTHDSDPRARQSAIKLRGLLDLLWERAGLETWRPAFTGRRSWYAVAALLGRTAETINVGRANLGERLGVIVPRPHPEAVRLILARRKTFIQRERDLVLIGALRGFGQERAGEVPVFLHAAQGAYTIRTVASAARVAAWQRSFHAELATLEDGDLQTVVIAHLQLNADGPDEIVDAAFTRVTTRFIPVASRLEARVADLLCDSGRTFRKPLRYDGDGLFPDFELLDTERIVPMEVFGRADAAYAARRDEKTALFRKLYGNDWWSWDATATDEIPPLPPAHRTRGFTPTTASRRA